MTIEELRQFTIYVSQLEAIAAAATLVVEDFNPHNLYELRHELSRLKRGDEA